MSTVRIPKTVAEAVSSLDGIGRLVQAREWERAAIVWALTHEGRTGGRRSVTNVTLSYSGLASKGITGLTSRQRVGWYHDQWQSAIDEGYAEPVALGDSIDIPDDWDWPPNDTVGERDTAMTQERRERLMEAGREAGMRTGSKVVDIAANTRSLQAAIKADPATARAAREALAQARMEAEDPTFPERHAKVERDMAADSAPWDAEIARAKRRERALMVCIWLDEWAREDGWTREHDIISLKLDELRGVIHTQAQALTPEMFTEGDAL